MFPATKNTHRLWYSKFTQKIEDIAPKCVFRLRFCHWNFSRLLLLRLQNNWKHTPLWQHCFNL